MVQHRIVCNRLVKDGVMQSFCKNQQFHTSHFCLQDPAKTSQGLKQLAWEEIRYAIRCEHSGSEVCSSHHFCIYKFGDSICKFGHVLRAMISTYYQQIPWNYWLFLTNQPTRRKQDNSLLLPLTIYLIISFLPFVNFRVSWRDLCVSITV